MAIRILVADDHELVKLGFRTLFGRHDDLEIVAETSGGDETLSAVTVYRPDIVLLDVRLSQGEGLTCLGRLKLDNPSLPVLMISTFDNPTYVARAVGAWRRWLPAQELPAGGDDRGNSQCGGW